MTEEKNEITDDARLKDENDLTKAFQDNQKPEVPDKYNALYCRTFN